MKKTKKLFSTIIVLSTIFMFAATAQAAHYHWYCSVNRFVSAKYGDVGSAAYAGGVHAQTYKHGSNVSYGSCTSSW
ncbi:hypothetical protein RyT2_07020 [Pseudolactococcus yaeyamensis]